MINPDFLNPREVLQNILEVLNCPFCGCNYLERNTKIRAQFGKDYIAHLTCDGCQNSIMASFSYRSRSNYGFLGQKIFNQKMDMPLNEIVGFVDKGTVNDNDVMDLFQSVKEFDGDFKKIFKIKN